MRTPVLRLIAATAVLALLAAGGAGRLRAADTAALVYLWSASCAPCRRMAPVIERIERAYAGRLRVVKIDVGARPAEPPPYGAKAVPTLIFFDARGREVHRHQGFMDERQLRRRLAAMGLGG